MSDLSGLPGIFSDSLRYNAETGVLSVSKYNAEVGERELQEIEFGPSATFVWDLRTRERGGQGRATADCALHSHCAS